MKSLSLSRPLIIMMVGLPGAGKSFFARKFSDTFNAPLISADFLRTEIIGSPTYSKEEDRLIDRLINNQAHELVKTGKSFIVDGSCNPRANRQEYERLARAKGYGTLIIWVQTDGPTCRARATRRNPAREGDILNISLSNEAFEALVKRFSAPHASEPSMVISGKHTFATQLRVVLKKLSPPARETTAPATHTPPPRPYGDISAKSHRVTIN